MTPNMPRAAHLTVLACIASGALLPVSAQAQEQQKWGARIEGEGKFSNHRSIGEGTLFMPVWQNENSLLFTDIRSRFDNLDSEEINLGLGYRQRINNAWIIGGYGFYDRRSSSHNNIFQQATLGIEALSEDLEFRINAYIPESREQDLGTPGVLAVLNGSNIEIQTFGASTERALPGADFEIGKHFDLPDNWDVWAYAGGYHFEADGYEDVSGVRGRIELSYTNVPHLPEGSRFTVGFETQRDSARGQQSYGIARLSLPLNFDGETPSTSTLSALDQRMTTRIVRDVDIVSAEREGQILSTEAATVTLPGGAAVSSVTKLDSTSTLPADVAAAGANSLVFLTEDVSTNTAVIVRPGQTIAGGGATFTATAASGATAPLTLPGSRPVITGTNDFSNVFIMSANSSLRNLSTDGGRTSVLVNIATGVSIENVILRNSDVNGLSVTNNGTAIVNNATIINAENHGIELSNGASLAIQNSVIDTTAVYGIDNQQGHLTANNSHVTNTGSIGIRAIAGPGSTSLNDVTISNIGAHALSVANQTLSGSGNVIRGPVGGGTCINSGGTTGSIAFDDILGTGPGTCP